MKALCPRCGAESEPYDPKPGCGWAWWIPWWIRHRLEGCLFEEPAERVIGPFPLPNQPSLVPVSDLIG